MGDINKPSSAFDTNETPKPGAAVPDAPKQKPLQKERAVPYETVPEAPGIRRQFLFPKEFNVYKDPIDANDRVTPLKKIDAVPALYTILEAPDAFKVRGESRIACVGDKDGKQLGWVNVRESGAQEWNIRSVARSLEPSAQTPVSLYANTGDVKPIRVEQPSDTNLYPVLAHQVINGNDWYRTVVPFPNLNTDSSREYWIKSQNEKYQPILREQRVLASEKEVRRLSGRLSLISEQLPQSNRSETDQKAIDDLVNASRVAWLQFLGIQSGNEMQSNITYLQQHFDGLPTVFQIKIDDIARLDQEEYANWKNSIIKRTQEMIAIIDHKLPCPTIEISNHGTQEKLFAMFTAGGY
ncbi:MAG: hypothetical protein WCG83_04855 [Candidatus Peregrinibacteria bacterium]